MEPTEKEKNDKRITETKITGKSTRRRVIVAVSSH